VALLEAVLGADHSETLQAMDSLAEDYRKLRRFPAAAEILAKTLAIQRAALGPDHLETASGMIRLANAYNDLGRHLDALKLREAALLVQRSKLPADHPDLLAAMGSLANSYGFLERRSEALELHREVLALRKAKFDPDHPAVLWSIWGVTAQLFALDRAEEALPMIDEVLERAARLKVQPDLVGLLNNRRSYFQKKNDVVGCRKTAELWEKLHRTDARSLYNAACYRAVTASVCTTTNKSPAAAQEAQAEADQAMAWLSQAIAAGYDNVALMKKDTDLDPLRHRADFQKLLTDLKNRYEKPAN
jgi:tetratricopeptide (TPR) repeat protein